MRRQVLADKVARVALLLGSNDTTTITDEIMDVGFHVAGLIRH